MRLLHTSDWHLGHTLHDQSREYEHECFLNWLLALIGEERADALLVSGDVFDTANPPAASQTAFYDFLAQARTRFPALDVIVIGGNHDSASRLDAPDAILSRLNVRVVGGFTRDGRPRELIFPLRGSDDAIAAWVAAVPFLRASDLRRDGESRTLDDAAAVSSLYASVLDEARARRTTGQALIATGHCYMVGTCISELSERKILGGNQNALPESIFPSDVAYAALGHLHLAQTVGGREEVRYSGSPIPLAMSEIDYPHQVCVVDFDGERLASVRAVRVPRFVPLLRVPARAAAPLDDVLAELVRLPCEGDHPERAPFLEVHVLLEKPDATLRTQVEAALRARDVRLMGIVSHYPGGAGSLGDQGVDATLAQVTPETVFAGAYRRKFDGDPPPELRAAFHELIETVGQEVAQ